LKATKSVFFFFSNNYEWLLSIDLFTILDELTIHAARRSRDADVIIKIASGMDKLNKLRPARHNS
jgi:hypothetical protein